jgi:hypothetical protein
MVDEIPCRVTSLSLAFPIHAAMPTLSVCQFKLTEQPCGLMLITHDSNLTVKSIDIDIDIDMSIDHSINQGISHRMGTRPIAEDQYLLTSQRLAHIPQHKSIFQV